MIGLRAFVIRQGAGLLHYVPDFTAAKHIVKAAFGCEEVGGWSWITGVKIVEVAGCNEGAKSVVFLEGRVSVEHDDESVALLLKVLKQSG